MKEACKSLKLVRFFIFFPLSFSSRRFFFVGRVLAHRFHRFTQIFFIMIFFHRISRINRRHSCLSDYSRNFAELWPLANGSRPIYAPVVFCHADFADDADFSLWEDFVPQIYTDFLHHDFSSSDFTDESEAFLLIGLLTEFRGILAAGQWLAPYICSCCFGHTDFADDADFSSWGLFCPTDFTDIHRFFMDSLLNLFVNLRGYLQRPDRSHLRKSVHNRLSRKSPNKFRGIR